MRPLKVKSCAAIDSFPTSNKEPSYSFGFYFPVAGIESLYCDGEALDLVPGQSALVSPRHALKILWSSECEQLIVRIPNALFHQAALDHMPWRQRLDMSKPLAPRAGTLPGSRIASRAWPCTCSRSSAT